MIPQTRVLLLGTAVVVAMCFGPEVTAQPQQPRFEFVAPAGVIVLGSGEADDVVVITGRSLGQRGVGTCGSNDLAYPLQMGVALDPGDQGRGPRITEIQPFTDDALRPGARVKNIALVSDCTIGGQSFRKFTGEIE